MIIKKLSVCFMGLAMAASFSFTSFCAGSYDFTDDGNTNNTSYSGTNFIGSDGVYIEYDPVTGLPVYKFSQDTIQNTYSGTTTIGMSQDGSKVAIYDGYDHGSTYNGTVSVTGSDVIPDVVTTVKNANVNANTTITAVEANSQNDLNAGVLIQDSTFTKDVTIQSSTVNLDSNANVILGSSSQMDTLLGHTNSINIAINNLVNGTNFILGHVYIIEDNLKNPRISTTQQTVSLPSQSPYSTVSYTLFSRTYYTYSVSNNQIVSTSETRYFNFAGLLMTRLSEIKNAMFAGLNLIAQRNTNVENYLAILIDNISTPRTRANPYTVTITTLSGNTVTYDLGPLTVNTFAVGDNLEIVNESVSRYSNYMGYWNFKTNEIKQLLRCLFEILKRSFISLLSKTYIMTDNLSVCRYSSSPATVSLTSIWGTDVTYPLMERSIRSFNFTNDQYNYSYVTRYCNFAGLLYAHLRVMGDAFTAYFQYQNAVNPGGMINNAVSDLSNNLTNYQTAEQNLQNQVTSSIQNFIPDLSLWGGFTAIVWASDYLQQIYLSLGSYGTVIMVGLLLGVCMQFIGYFRYKY